MYTTQNIFEKCIRVKLISQKVALDTKFNTTCI